jgi:hypothetical protein
VAAILPVVRERLCQGAVQLANLLDKKFPEE